ncbi:RNA-binding, RBD [Glarea lozoyensis ATCC 20868]|uniref:RNA-binding, RBD n=1 Tax=Glarea lozoyensis (strain ATCC 20868 / MF5171) TaxID=1116229 RepID=S3CPZ5_GLAL2|nr:RNA-binding, RBD [Glarea lozoyensis ATCC 20868]EPE28557.1 RNA-binding, RBD [Glarea lozoyensis ATCC 20868]
MAPHEDVTMGDSDGSEIEVETIAKKTKKDKTKDRSKPRTKEKSGKEKSGKEKSGKKRKVEELSEEPIPTSIPSPETSSALLEPDSEVQDEDVASSEESNKPSSKKRKPNVGEEIEVDITLPEPPSKKALRALKKGKPLPPSKSGAETTPEPEAKKAKAEVEKRSEHGIWIGNLAFHISKEDLRKFFVEKSDITDDLITRIHMPGPNDKKSANKVEERRNGKTVHNTGYAYVDFSTAEGATEAVELSEQLLGGRRVLIKNNKSFEGRPQKTKEESRNEGKPPSKRVFVGNLPFDATEAIIQSHYEKCGAIGTLKLATFEDSGKCKGYGWVTFDELEGAQNCVRGYVLVEEELSDDSESEDKSGSGDEGTDITKVKSEKKPKKRKVWCNRLNGRALRTEFAEDAQVRYKKRYGKDGTKQQAAAGSVEKATEPAQESHVIIPKVVEYRKEYAPRLTGGIVESKGKKVTF